MAVVLTHAPAWAQGVAGSPIINRAAIRYDLDGAARSGASNEDRFLIAERLDVVARLAASAARLPSGGFALPVTIENRGNGSEAFALEAAVANAGASVLRIAVDADANGRFDEGADRILVDARSPALAPGESLALLLLGERTSDASPPDAVIFVARSVTGSGSPGTVFTTRGDGGGDAVVGPTGAEARLEIPLDRPSATATLVKSQSVLAPDGSSVPIRGAIITYTLAARFDEAATSARIADPLPPGTKYRPNSLRLDDIPMTDAPDDDRCSVDEVGIVALLGTVPAGETHTVRFQVTIQ